MNKRQQIPIIPRSNEPVAQSPAKPLLLPIEPQWSPYQEGK